MITPAPLASRTATPDGVEDDRVGGASAPSKRPYSSTDWIFDTGATTHVCTNRALLHSYVTLNPYTAATSSSARPVAVGHFGPNPVPIVGVGDCTFVLPSPASSSKSPSSSSSLSSALSLSIPRPSFSKTSHPSTDSSSSPSSPLGPLDDETPREHRGNSEAIRITLGRVMHIPSAGVNLISWSQLKRSKGFDTQLVEEPDGSLIVRDRATKKSLMRFVLKGGLYVLVQEPHP